MQDVTWRRKAERIIGDLCRASYLQANSGRKRHRSYRVPEDAEVLIHCLNTDDEQTAKAVFIRHAYGLVNR